MPERPRPNQPRRDDSRPRRVGGGPSSSQLPRSARDHPLLPRPTRQFLPTPQQQTANPGLLFDRFAPETAVFGDTAEGTPRRDFLRQVLAAAERLAADKLAQEILARWEATVRAAGAEPVVVELQSRLVTGLGAHGPLEIGFRFDRLGFPVLPGSGLKGVARAYAHLVVGLEETNEDFRQVFGHVPKKEREGESETDAEAGSLVFFDAYPEPGWRLELDVMTPHYPEYYAGKAPPTPWQNPTPITFLTVAPGTRYRVAVGLRQGIEDPGGRLRTVALKWLLAGLAQLGFGAKTTSGYGVFRSGG